MRSMSQAKNYPARPEIDAASAEPGGSLALMLGMVGERKKVLDVGCATGYLAKLMAAKQCDITGLDVNPSALEAARAYCTRTILTDLDTTPLSQSLEGMFFDVIVFGDVLEHLRAPGRTLEEARASLLDDGYVIASIPNIAHGAIRLALLGGHFDYQEFGLLDDTHIRFFTAKSVDELFLDAGYRIEAIERTRLPIFEPSDLLPQVRSSDYPAAIVEEIESDPESTTFQFVVKAYPISNEAKYRVVAKRFLSVNTALSNATTQLYAQQREIESLRRTLGERDGQLTEVREHLAVADREMRKAQTDFNRLAPQVQEGANLQAQIKQLTATQDLYKIQAEGGGERLQAAIADAHRMEIALVRAQEQLRFAQVRLAESSATFYSQRTSDLEEIASLRASAANVAEHIAAAKAALFELESLRTRNRELTEANGDLARALIASQAQSSESAARVDQLSASSDLSERFAAHAQAAIDQAHAEAQEIALQIDHIQSGRLWRFKRFVRKLLA
jgi:2-polyprenyl-3-methyl-5-hydroxy-6-metoxy-1,4-benzoquinol methylase